MATCKICNKEANAYCKVKILNKYEVQYYKCTSCGFIYTEEPYWLGEAYESAITRLDIGLIERNQIMIPLMKTIINKWFNPNAKFIDYGGGYGMFVRMMRDNGYDYFRQDVYCANLYADSFDIVDVPAFRAEIVTAFEVMEHLVDPVNEIRRMLTLSDTIVFSTTVQPTDFVMPDSWWYFTPETGQHISLYSRESLEKIAEITETNYYWNEQNIHMFSKKTMSIDLFKIYTHPKVNRIYSALFGGKKSLQPKDFVKVKNTLS